MGVPLDDEGSGGNGGGKGKAIAGAAKETFGKMSDKFQAQAQQSISEMRGYGHYDVAPTKVDTPKAELPTLGSFKRGGKIPKTGVYRLHEGERVLNVKQTRKFERGKTGRRCGR